jgi:hypothetical protein
MAITQIDLATIPGWTIPIKWPVTSPGPCWATRPLRTRWPPGLVHGVRTDYRWAGHGTAGQPVRRRFREGRGRQHSRARHAGDTGDHRPRRDPRMGVRLSERLTGSPLDATALAAVVPDLFDVMDAIGRIEVRGHGCARTESTSAWARSATAPPATAGTTWPSTPSGCSPSLDLTTYSQLTAHLTQAVRALPTIDSRLPSSRAIGGPYLAESEPHTRSSGASQRPRRTNLVLTQRPDIRICRR